jgi:hypothetical protein
VGSFSGLVTPSASDDSNSLKDFDNKSDLEINNLLNEARDKASEVLNQFRIQLGKFSQLLFEEETMNEDRIREIFLSPEFQELCPKLALGHYQSKLAKFITENNEMTRSLPLALCS